MITMFSRDNCGKGRQIKRKEAIIIAIIIGHLLDDI